MKKILSSIKTMYKAIIKKLNNNRLLAVIVSSINLIAGGSALALAFIYHFAMGPNPNVKNGTIPSFAGLDGRGEIGGKVMGMIFFLSLVFMLAFAIGIIYLYLPSVRNKEKITPKKTPLVLALVDGVFGISVLIFSILAIVLENPITKVGYIICIPFVAISIIGNLLCIFPLLRCVPYQPAIGSKLFPKKHAEEEVK